MGVAPTGSAGRHGPSWLTWLVVVGLAAVYAGERIASAVPIARLVLSGGGALLVLVATVWRFVSWRLTTGDARRVERLFLLAYLGCLLSLIGFFLAGDLPESVGIEVDDPEIAARSRTAATVLACILLSVSLLPALAAQWAVGERQHGGKRETTAVDRLRITQLGAAGLSVGLAGAFLFLAGWITAERDKTLDLSYFRTATPGSAAQQIVASRGSPLRVLLFFPPANEVKDQVLGYFRALDAVAQNVTIEQYDRLAAPDSAAQHRVTQDGSVVLAYNDRSEIIALPVELRDARTRLRAFDAEVQRALMRVARDEKTIYLTTGHGELNDPSSTGPLEATPFRSIDAMRKLFGLLNYRVADLGIQGGLGNDVPADAAMVLVLGPSRPFLEPELQSLDRYLERGGSVLFALEPEGTFKLGLLRQRLGVEYRAIRLADDRQHVRMRGNLGDRRLIVTDRFSSHASLSTLGRVGVGSGMLLMGAGYLEPADSTAQPPTFVVRSLPSTFADRDGDLEFDDKAEERKMYSLVAALELPSQPGTGTDTTGTVTPPVGGRAMVFADAELFSDAVVTSLGLNAALAADAVRWLGREENMAGETRSEEDVPIVHTRAENVAWFYSTILGAPALILGLGLLGVRRRRKVGREEDGKRGRKEEKKERKEEVSVGAGPDASMAVKTAQKTETVNR